MMLVVDRIPFLRYDGEKQKTNHISGAKVADILIDQGLADEFFDEKQLLPENFQAACDKAGQAVTIRLQEGYDHSYHFIATFIGEHIAYHAKALKR